MLRVLLSIFAILLLFTGQIAIAKTLYTWTDENGVVHISATKPPAGTQPEDKITYKAKPKKQTTQTENNTVDQQRNLIQEYEARRKAQRLRREADKARETMEAAVEEANQMRAETDEYIRQWGIRARYRKSIKAKIDRKKDATNQAVAESERLIKVATEKEAKARQAEQELNDLKQFSSGSPAVKPKPAEAN